MSPNNRGRLNLPESFASGRNYWVQYGRRNVFGVAGNWNTTLRVPAAAFTGVTLDALVSEISAGSLTFRLDVGNDGSWEWEWTNNVSGATTLTSPDLAAAFSRYWSTHGAPTSGTMDVPVRIYLGKAGQVFLSNLQVTSTGSQVRYVRLPVQKYASVVLSLTAGTSGSCPLTLGVDVDDDGSVDWTYGASPTLPAHITTGNLAAAFNAYLSGRTGEVDVLVRFYPAPFLSLTLDDYHAVASGQPDLSLVASGITVGSASATEGDGVSVTAEIQNNGDLLAGGSTVAFYAESADWGEWYIGSAYVPAVPAGGTAQATILWNTLGFTGAVPVRVVLDPYNRLAETNETNNEAATSFTILTRPDMLIPSLELSDGEPVSGEAVSVTLTLRNRGQTTAGAETVALYEGNPDDGGLSLGTRDLTSLAAGASTPVALSWEPLIPGPYRLFARADREDQVDEYDEGNNEAWRDVYVGFAGPILIDSGGASDPAYTSTIGYGYLTSNTRVVTCGTEPEETLRAAYGDRLDYRFDHLLPGHFYHLDITLRDCDGSRAEAVYVDDTLVIPAVDLSDREPHRLSVLLDPALYADHTIVASILETHGLDALVAEISVHDVDYRYADAGGGQDPNYPAAVHERPYGWLDGEPLTSWGALPYQTVRMDRADTETWDDPDNELRYRFDAMDPARRYRLHLTFRQAAGTTIVQKLQIDGVDASPSFNLDSGETVRTTVTVPPAAYQDDGSIVVGVVRVDCTSSEAQANEIALEEQTSELGSPCDGLIPTPARTIAHGSVTIAGQPAPAGTVIQALNPRDDVVGCGVVQTAGQYGYIQIYGEAAPDILGMRASEIVEFRVNGIPAVAVPSLYWQDDKAPHQVDLAIGSTEGQCTWLRPNWNLISFRPEPPVPSVEDVLRSVDGRYCRVLGENGVFDCTLAPVYQTLDEMHPGLGYYLQTTGTTGANLRVEGMPLAAGTPLPLHEYWNWVGYLPAAPMPVATALSSIDGSYLMVLSLDKTYDPAHPELSDLQNLDPGQGYLIRATSPVTLIYPELARTSTEVTEAESPPCDAVSPTPYRTLVYGKLTLGDRPAPVGTRVEVITPRGEVAGCSLVREAGLYGYVQVYGEDGGDPRLPGFRPGEPLAYRVNGLPAVPASELNWADDLMPHAVDLLLSVHSIYLPLIISH